MNTFSWWKEHVEFVVAVLGIITTILTTTKVVIPWWRKRREGPRKFVIPVDLLKHDARIHTPALRQMLAEAARDAASGAAVEFVFVDPYVKEMKKYAAKQSLEMQRYFAETIAGFNRKLSLLSRMMAVLFQGQHLSMLHHLLFSGNELATTALGAIDLIMTADVTGRTRLDVWVPHDPRLTFGIYLNDDELKLTLDKLGVSAPDHLVGGLFTVPELPIEVQIRHVIPRLLLLLAGEQDSSEAQDKLNALMLHRYAVGLG